MVPGSDFSSHPRRHYLCIIKRKKRNRKIFSPKFSLYLELWLRIPDNPDNICKIKESGYTPMDYGLAAIFTWCIALIRAPDKKGY